LTAVHEIVHTVFDDRHESLLVYSVEVNKTLGCNLDLSVAFDEINEATFFNFVILFPKVHHLVIIIASADSLEEEDGV
jgi:hypothetical protein